MSSLETNSLDGLNAEQKYQVMKEMGDCCVTVGDYSGAQKCYDQASEFEPDEAGPYLGTAVMALQNGKLSEAKAAFNVAKRLNPYCSRTYAGLAMVAQQTEDFSGAFDNYLKALELDPDNLASLLGLFQASCQMRSFAKVIYYLEVYLKMHSGDESVSYCLATLYMKEGMLDEARDLLEVMVVDNPNDENAMGLLEEVINQMTICTAGAA